MMASNNNNNNNSSNTNGEGIEIDNSKTNLIINYLPQQMTDQDFRVLFAQIGDIRSAKIIRKKSTGYSYGFGFVDYLRPEDAEKAIQTLNGHLVEHKKIKVAFARPSGESIKQANLYVKNLPTNYSENDIRELFSPFGAIIQCRIVGNRGVAFVLYDLHEQAIAAIEAMNGKILPGANEGLSVKFAIDNAQKFRSSSHSSKGMRGQSSQPNASQLAFGTSRGYAYSHMPYEAYSGSGPMRHLPHMNRDHRFNPLSNIQPLHSYQSYPSQTPLGYNPSPVQPPLPVAPSMPAPPPPPPPPPPPTIQMPIHATAPPLNNGFNAEKGGFILFAYNIGPETNEYSLGELFGTYGKVVRCNVIRKGESGESKGFGFVTMKNYHEALNAITALNGYNFSGKPLQVSFKK